jgi:hypothetical protein
MQQIRDDPFSSESDIRVVIDRVERPWVCAQRAQIFKFLQGSSQDAKG